MLRGSADVHHRDRIPDAQIEAVLLRQGARVAHGTIRIHLNAYCNHGRSLITDAEYLPMPQALRKHILFFVSKTNTSQNATHLGHVGQDADLFKKVLRVLDVTVLLPVQHSIQFAFSSYSIKELSVRLLYLDLGV